MTEQSIFRPREAQRYLSISRTAYYALVAAGELPVVRLGVRSVGVRRADLDAFIERRTETREPAYTAGDTQP
ncbi:MAG: helix-turn-helix domain-containing protein [Gammaproteobacteria bacterium]|nr:helix-turn-helix domain-containing protein [Gammaproteobacteria bacterium]